MAGRPPKPTKLKLIAGNPGKRPLPENEPQPVRLDSLEPPKSMIGRISRQKWRELVGDLDQMGILGTTDREALARYCELYETYRKTLTRLRRDHEVREDGKPNKLIRTVDTCIQRMIPLLRELGMTPASRSKVTAIDKANRGSDEWSDDDDDFETAGA